MIKISIAVTRLIAAAGADTRDQRDRVAEAFRQLDALRSQIRLEGDLKTIARKGLD